MITGTELINGAGGVRVTLLDAAKVTWSDAELLGYLNEALRTTCLLKTDAYTRRAYIAMVLGTKQELPEGGTEIFDLFENEGSGRAVTLADRSLIDTENRFWPASTYEIDVQNWAADPRDPKRFDVTPPNNGYGSVGALFGAVPDELASIGDEIPLQDIYEHPLKLFVMAKAYAKNTKRQDLAKSETLMQGFRAALGVKTQNQFALAPTPARAANAGA